MNLFAESDQRQLIGQPSLFDRKALMRQRGDWGLQLLRASTAMEMLAQITARDLSVLLKVGTLLQHSLAWPPYRASVDLDLEVKDAEALKVVLHQIEDSFGDSDVHVTIRDAPLPGFTGDLGFPRTTGPDWALRIDALENEWWPSEASPWQEIPRPWENARKPQVAPVETRVAQKLLLAAEAPYGRDLDSHHGRQNFIKDLFDLRCLGELTLQDDNVPEAVQEDVERKSEYLGREVLLDHCSMKRYSHSADSPIPR